MDGGFSVDKRIFADANRKGHLMIRISPLDRADGTIRNRVMAEYGP
jgi:hypothetical protein